MKIRVRLILCYVDHIPCVHAPCNWAYCIFYRISPPPPPSSTLQISYMIRKLYNTCCTQYIVHCHKTLLKVPQVIRAGSVRCTVYSTSTLSQNSAEGITDYQGWECALYSTRTLSQNSVADFIDDHEWEYNTVHVQYTVPKLWKISHVHFPKTLEAITYD